jgi:hypothetical protein
MPRSLEKKRAAARRQYRKNPEAAKAKIRAHYFRRVYGMTLDEYADMCVKQGGKCSICQKVPEHKVKSRAVLHVDHDHETGKVRGLLCTWCNMALGQLGDTAESVQRVLDYLNGGSGAQL